MNTKTLSKRALVIIDQYLHFRVGSAICSIPYFNNKTKRAHATLRTNIGKGNPRDISDEIHDLLVKTHIPQDKLTDESLKRLLVDQNIGIDCSGFAYYILDAESIDTSRGPLSKRISFINCKNIIDKVRCSFRPVENCDVATLANDKNSVLVAIENIVPGDIITMLGTGRDGQLPIDRDHILVIHQVEYLDNIPKKIYYSHAIAYPEDGIYGNGIRQGIIEISDHNKLITEAVWTEDGRQGELNSIFTRAKKSKTEIRRIL